MRGGAVARYVRVRPPVAASRLARMIARYWKLQQPSALLSIIGGSSAGDSSAGPEASTLCLPPDQQLAFGRGLAAADFAA